MLSAKKNHFQNQLFLPKIVGLSMQICKDGLFFNGVAHNTKRSIPQMHLVPKAFEREKLSRINGVAQSKPGKIITLPPSASAARPSGLEGSFLRVHGEAVHQRDSL